MKRKDAIIGLSAIAVIAILVIYGSFDPEEAVFFPRCPFLALTGLKCPGCGSQRALHELLTLHPAAAFRCNPLVLIALVVFVFTVAAWLARERRPSIWKLVKHHAFLWGLVVMIILWGVVRNVLGL